MRVLHVFMLARYIKIYACSRPVDLTLREVGTLAHSTNRYTELAKSGTLDINFGTLIKNH